MGILRFLKTTIVNCMCRSLLFKFPYSHRYLCFIFLFLFVFAYSATAQRNFTSGYIITLPGDTLRGFINEKGWEINPKNVQFITSLNADPIIYEVQQLQGFFVENTGDFYKRAIVTIDYTPHKIDDILDVKRLAALESQYIKLDTVFVRELVRGKASLYFLKDRMGKTHFFASKQPHESLFELINRAYRIGNQIGYSAAYRTQLQGLLSEDTKAVGSVETSSYTGFDLSKIFVNYNRISKQRTLVRPVAKDLFRLYALSGLSLIKPHVIGDQKIIYPSRFDYVASPFIGFGLNTILARSRQKFSIYNEVSYKTYKAETIDEYNYVGVQPKRQTIRMEANYLKWTGGFRYALSTHRLKPYVQVGMTAGRSFEKMDVLKEEYVNSGIVQERPVMEMDGWYDNEFGWTVSAVTVYKRFLLEGRYERILNMSEIIRLKYYTTSFTFMVGYQINYKR